MVKRGRGRKRKVKEDPVLDEEQNKLAFANSQSNTTLKDRSDDDKESEVVTVSHAESKAADLPTIEEVKGEGLQEGDSKDDDSNEYSKIRKCIVENDGTEENLVRLIGLKNLFSKQLPKMPRDYIVRLVFDRRHKSLAILSDDPKVKGTDDEIIGGICYRAYPDMKFAEIAFCAVSQAQQVKVRYRYYLLTADSSQGTLCPIDARFGMELYF